MKKKIIFSSMVLIIMLLVLMLLIPASLEAKEYEIFDYDIDITVENKGDYLITETITFNFLGGDYSWISRDIMGEGYNMLKFISIEGVDTSITSYEVDQGDDLRVKWYFNETKGRKKFIIRYRALGGLITDKEKNINIIKFMAVDTGWEVPIYDLDINIKLPQSVNDIDAIPYTDLIQNDGNIISFSKSYLAPSDSYNIELTIPLIMETERTVPVIPDINIPTGLITAVLIGLIVGLLAVVIDFKQKEEVNPIKTDYNMEYLTWSEISLIYRNGNRKCNGIMAQIFTLAKRGHLKFISNIKKSYLGSKSNEINVKTFNRDELNKDDLLIYNKLRKYKTLDRFTRDNKLFKKINNNVIKRLKRKKFISRSAMKNRKGIKLSALLLITGGLIALIFGSVEGLVLTIGLGSFMITFGFGRSIKAKQISILSGEGEYIKEKIEKIFHEKKDKLDYLIEAEEPDSGLRYFFKNFEYLIINKEFSYDLWEKYKNVFKKAEEIEIPDWLEFEVLYPWEEIEAADIVRVIENMLITLSIINPKKEPSSDNNDKDITEGGGAAG